MVMQMRVIWLPVAVGFLVVMLGLAGRAFFAASDFDVRVARQDSVLGQLVPMVEEAWAIHATASDWAVGGAMSAEIRQTIAGAFPQADFPDAAMISSYRLHKAMVSFSGQPPEQVLSAFGVLEGLPVRAVRFDVRVEEDDQMKGEIDLVWLELIL